MTDKVMLVATGPELRVDKFIAGESRQLSRAFIKELISQGKVTVNGKCIKPSYTVKTGDRVSVDYSSIPLSEIAPENIPLCVIYEDRDLAVIDKPPGLTTHPAPGNRTGTLLNALIARFPELRDSGTERPGIVHRLDKDTSGLMVVARSRKAQCDLSEQFKRREVTKVYLVLVKGHVQPSSGIIEAAIGRHKVNRKKMAVTENGREARSQYRVIEYFKEYTLLEVRIFTGRTHQIRVHLAAIGFPVVGDSTYGVTSESFPRQFVHAHRISFKQPDSGQLLDFTSKLPPDLEGPLSRLV